MKNKFFIKTLRTTISKLRHKKTLMLSELKRIESLTENDPERSSLHELWHTYSLLNEFKEFTENILSKQIKTSGAISR